jgi:hypothetical protein
MIVPRSHFCYLCLTRCVIVKTLPQPSHYPAIRTLLSISTASTPQQQQQLKTLQFVPVTQASKLSPTQTICIST